MACSRCCVRCAPFGDQPRSACNHARPFDRCIPKILRSCVPNSLPSRREGRAAPGHGGGHGRPPSAPDAATPGNSRPVSTHPTPCRADLRSSRFPIRQAAAPPAGRARRGRRRGEELKIWNPGNLGVRERAAGSQVPRFPARRLALAPGDRRRGVAPRPCGDPARLKSYHTRNRIGCRYTPRDMGAVE